MDTGSFPIYIETKDFYKDIADDVESKETNFDENKTG